jgi:putative ABC transport system ATP-binding protein
MAGAAALAILATGISSYFMTSRLFTASERGLATLRTKAFRHVHDLPLLTQNTERRGALVSRVTSDVDQVSQFLVFGGILGVVSVGQVLLATVVMLFYSWQLTLLVWVCFLPLFLSLRFFQRRLSLAYGVVRRSVGSMLSAISEPVVGAVTVRTYAIEQRTQDRIDEAIAVNGRAGQRRGTDRRHLARARGRHHLRRGAGLRFPGDPVRGPGPDGHAGAHRRPERDRRVASGDRHPGHPG